MSHNESKFAKTVTGKNFRKFKIPEGAKMPENLCEGEVQKCQKLIPRKCKISKNFPGIQKMKL